ncbi:MAG: DUF3267 domain-containing protein [Ruminococcus sp.]|jgi:hypothetical protein|nr:DUF3267 domain-containing protein [Ruminococcus sp.]
MKMTFRGDFNGDPETLPNAPHEPGAIKFKEVDDPKKLGVFLNVLAVLIVIPLYIFYRSYGDPNPEWWETLVGVVAALALMVPHEFLHALCLPGETFMYTWKAGGMFFVFSPERISKARFIFMSLLPNLCFGIIPFIIFLFTHQIWLGTISIIGIAAGAGDYYNVFNCITQVPNGHKVYNYGINTYRYDPKAETIKAGAEIGL